MILADWAMLAAIFLPLVTVGIAKGGSYVANTARYDNARPREWAERVAGWPKRAEWAHRNHFEILPGFLAGVLLAQMLHAPVARIDHLAIAFIAFRVLYTAAYIANWSWLRSGFYVLAFICVVRLFEAAAGM
ncbi:MAG: MAPEG family protein [Rhodospirillales bacterium]|nr:MAPEG family protein [Rhodospirillales bacterium]